MPTKYRTIQGDTIDAIAYRHYGRHDGTTEAILEANRGLAEKPLMLTEGTIIILPDLDNSAPIQTVKLYD